MWSLLHKLGLGPPCHRCGAKVTHRPDLFRLDDRQCCAECFYVLHDLRERHRAEEVARSRIRYADPDSPSLLSPRKRAPRREIPPIDDVWSSTPA